MRKVYQKTPTFAK